MRKNKSNSSLKKNDQNTLSIQFSLDGFSFCVLDLNTKEILYFSEYIFDNTLNSLEELLENIKNIFNEDAILHNEFESVLVIHQHNLNTLVPDAFFDEKSIASYLNLNIKTLQTDFITFDSISTIESKNIYIPYVNINNYLFQNFGEFEFTHHATILIDKLIDKNNNTQPVVYVNVSATNFDMVVLEHKKLILYNSFSYKTKEDFIYYILFVFEQLQLNNEVCNLYFLGAIDLDSELYKITYKYVKNVSFLESNSPIFKELNTKKNSNFILLG